MLEAGEGIDLSLAAAQNPGRDLVVTLPGVVLPFAWEERLRKAAYASPRIAAAIPLCDATPITALVDEDLRERTRSEAERIDRTAYVMGARSYYEVPRPFAVCVYLRRDALDLALPSLPAGKHDAQAMLDKLAARWTELGWSTVLCDYVYVPFPRALDVTPTFEENAFLQHHPLGALKRAVNNGIREGLPPVSVPGLDSRPVHLHVMHFWGGGLDRWVRDFGRADSGATHMILASYRIGEKGGQRIVLYSDPAAMIPVRVWDIARPITATLASSLEYRRILEQVIREFDVEAIVVSSLIGHTLDALDQPVRTVVVLHDFYPVCQAINPRFGTTCERCTLEDLRRCNQSNPLNTVFKGHDPDAWHAMRGQFVERLLARSIPVVVPSPSVAATLRKIEPRLDGHPVHVIPHGIDFAAEPLSYPARAPGEKLRLVVLGRLSLQKGTDLLRSAAAELAPYADVTIVGGGKNGVELAALCGWQAIERYELEELPGLLRTIAPHAGVLASVIPETFSYTLSELRALGIPPLATALGSFNDRIAEGETGFLYTPDKDALVALVRRLHAEPALLDNMARGLAARRERRGTAEMVKDYRALLPIEARAVARFEVGIGEHTALTEPYRHLEEAYAHLRGAYAQANDAYGQTKQAYEGTRAELDQMRGAWASWNAQWSALDVRRHWWRLPKAIDLVSTLADKMNSTKGKP